MSFAHPERLWLLVLVPLLGVWIGRGRRRRAEAWSLLGWDRLRQRDGALGWLASIVCLIVALGQPRWGRVPGSDLPPGHDVVLAIDVSRSMAAEDAVPNRLGVAVEAAESLVEALGRESGDRVAVVAFAGRGVVRCPLTENLGAVVDTLRALRPGDVEPGGTDLGDALDVALDTFDATEPAEGRTIVLFSDGEDHSGTWKSVTPRLNANRVIVHAIGIGDPDQGHPIPSTARSKGGLPSVLTYRGETVLSRRNDEALRALSRETGGAWLPLGLAATDLGALYRDRIAPIARLEREATRTPERVERFAVLLVAALLFGLGGSARWPTWRPLLVSAPLVASILGAGPGVVGPSLAEAVRQGQAAFARADYEAALASFELAIALAPKEAIPRYNAAATLFSLGRFDEAASRYREARDLADESLRIKIDYALGNVAVALGQYREAIEHYEACLSSKLAGLAFDAIRRDAAINREFALRRLKVSPAAPEASPNQKPPDQEPGRRPPEDQGKDGSTAPPPPEGGALGTPHDVGREVVGSRRTGGGGGTAMGAQRSGSPADRLAEALDRIREARDSRPGLPVIPPASEDRKDW